MIKHGTGLARTTLAQHTVVQRDLKGQKIRKEGWSHSCIPEDRNTAEPLSPKATVATETKGCLCRWSRRLDGQFFATCVSQSVSQVMNCSFHLAIEMAITTNQRLSPDLWVSYRELSGVQVSLSGAEQAHSAPRSLCCLCEYEHSATEDVSSKAVYT